MQKRQLAHFQAKTKSFLTFADAFDLKRIGKEPIASQLKDQDEGGMATVIFYKSGRCIRLGIVCQFLAMRMTKTVASSFSS